MRPLSKEAAAVLRQMEGGHRLVGSILKRDVPFVLEFLNGTDDIPFMTAAELIDMGYVIPVAARGPDNAEYELRFRTGIV